MIATGPDNKTVKSFSNGRGKADSSHAKVTRDGCRQFWKAPVIYFHPKK